MKPSLHFPTLLVESRQTIALAAPISAGFVGQMLLGLTDTLMIARVGVLPLAACAFANTIIALFIVFGFGLMSSVSIRASQAFGAKNAAHIAMSLVAGLALGIVSGLALAGVIELFHPWTKLMGQNDDVVAASNTYLRILAWSMIPSFIMSAGKGFSEALSRPWIPFIATMIGVILNIFLNWLLIFGHWGIPAMGLNGAGYATLLSRILSVALLYIIIFRAERYRPYRPHFINWKILREEFSILLRLGIPAGFQSLSEVGMFAFSSIMMGWISIEALAAHQIALTCAATTMMFPLGLSIALTVRAGQTIGAHQHNRLLPIVSSTLGITVLMMTCFAIFFFIGAPWIPALFVQDPAVIHLASNFLIIAAIFQIADGCQLVSTGGLRGISDVRSPMLIAFSSYWLIATPLALFLTFQLHLGAINIWIGLTVGLYLVAIILSHRLWRAACKFGFPGMDAQRARPKAELNQHSKV